MDSAEAALAGGAGTMGAAAAITVGPTTGVSGGAGKMRPLPNPEGQSYGVRIKIHRLKNLQSFLPDPDPYNGQVIVSAGDRTHKTEVIKGSMEPIFDEDCSFTFEKVISDGNVSVGIAIPYIFADETVSVSGYDPEKITYSGTPVMLTCKYNIFNGRFAAYAGAGIGVHWSSLKRHEGTVDEVSSSFTGMALGVPVGVAFFLAEDLYLQGVYSLSYMSTTPLRDDIAHGFLLGLGFQWGKE